MGCEGGSQAGSNITNLFDGFASGSQMPEMPARRIALPMNFESWEMPPPSQASLLNAM